jgi:hypothetical protein
LLFAVADDEVIATIFLVILHHKSPPPLGLLAQFLQASRDPAARADSDNTYDLLISVQVGSYAPRGGCTILFERIQAVLNLRTGVSTAITQADHRRPRADPPVFVKIDGSMGNQKFQPTAHVRSKFVERREAAMSRFLFRVGAWTLTPMSSPREVPISKVSIE